MIELLNGLFMKVVDYRTCRLDNKSARYDSSGAGSIQEMLRS